MATTRTTANATSTTRRTSTKAGTVKVTTPKTTSRTGTVDAGVETGRTRFDVRGAVDPQALRRPFYAYAGVASLAVSRVRELADQGYRLPDLQEQLNKAASQSREQLHQLRSQGQSLRSLPQDVRSTVDETSARAQAVYGDLVTRGEKLVGTVRSNANARTVVDEAKAAVAQLRTSPLSVSQLKAASEHAKRAVKASEAVAEDTVDELG